MIELNLQEIKNAIPHREPFLLVDRAEIIDPDDKIIGYKHFKGDEEFYKGHFPGTPITPGVLIIEAMAQTSCILFLGKPELKNKLAFFMSIDKTKFRKPVFPGDTVKMEMIVLHRSGTRAGKVRGVASVNNEVVVETEFLFAMTDKPKKI